MHNPHRRSRVRFLVFSLLPATVCGALIGLGYVVGRHRALAPLHHIATQSGSLGGLAAALAFSGLPREIAPPAYLDPAAAERDLDGYCYAPPGVPTPFVGSMSMPGVHRSARINSDQFRSDTEVTRPKPPGCFRVIITGGSTAWGSGAPSNATTIAGYLESELRQSALASRTGRIEVLNAACPGWTTTHERILIENKIAGLEPDLVIAISGTNDVHFGLARMDVIWLRGYGDWPIWTIAQSVYESAGRGWVDVVPELPERPQPSQVAQRLCWNLKLASCALLAVRERGVPFVFVLQPIMPTTRKVLSVREQGIWNNAHHGRLSHLRDGGADYFKACYAAIREAAAAVASPNYRFVDGSTMFDDLDAGTEVFLDTYHFGDRGNQLIARFVAAELADTFR